MKTRIKSITLRSVAVAALAAASGCTWLPSVGPDYEEPKFDVPEYALPDAGQPTTNLTPTAEYKPVSSNEDTRVVISDSTLAQWWKRFDDPVLVKLVEGGISNNVGYLMAQRRLEASAYELLGSYADFMPKFSASGGWTRHWFGSGDPTHYNVRSAALDGRWEIDIFGGNRRQCEAALAHAESAGWTVADAWLSLTTQIGETYINLRTTQARIDVARTNLVLQSETYDILKSRLDSGIGDELAVNQCAYVVDQTRAKIPQLLAEEESYKNALAILAGEMPGSLHDLLKPVDVGRDWLLAPQKVSELSLDMMRGRPDVKIAERSLAAQMASIGVAKADWFPKLYITGSLGWENRGKTRLFSKESFFATLGPAVSWPIFQGGAIYANVKAAEARTSEAALNYELAVETAYKDVRNAYAYYTNEYLRNKALAGAVKAATDAVTTSQDLYKNGLKDFTNVIDAQRSRLQYEEEFVISRGQITLDLIRLYKALGGGLSADDEEE